MIKKPKNGKIYGKVKINMKKFLKLLLEIGIVTSLMIVFLNLSPLVAGAAQGYLPIGENVNSVFKGNVPTPPEDNKTGQQIVIDLALRGLTYVKILIAVVAVLMITILGAKLVLASGEEEDITKSKRGLIYSIIALAIISMSQDLAKIFDMADGSILESPQEILKRVHIFDKQVEILMTFIKYIIGSAATIMVVYSAARLITAGGDEEKVSTHKAGIMYSAGGLILIYIGDIFINKVFYKIDKNVYTGITGVNPTIDVKAGVEEIAGIINFMVAFLAPLSILMLIAGAIMYATAGGEEEKMNQAKRIIISTVLAIIVIYGAFAIVSTVISSRLADIGALAE